MKPLRLEAARRVFSSRRGGDVEALHPLDLEIAPGEHVAIVGPSGSGKSTLLLMLGGMMAPTAGRVLHGERDIYGLTTAQRAAWRRDEVGFLFQSYHLVPYLSAFENVRVPLWMAGRSDEEAVARTHELMKEIGLEDRSRHKPSELSSGQRQRVALARALANDPGIILADEPTGQLDPDNAELVASSLDRLASRGRTVVLVTHDPDLAARAQRTIHLRAGSLAT